MQKTNEMNDKVTVCRFDIFKGRVDNEGRVEKVKTIGSAYLREGLHTYTLHLKTFLEDTFYLLQNTKQDGPDFVILTREIAYNLNRKYYWNCVGQGNVMSDANAGIMKLDFDLFGENIYMTVEPISTTEASNNQDSSREEFKQSA